MRSIFALTTIALALTACNKADDHVHDGPNFSHQGHMEAPDHHRTHGDEAHDTEIYTSREESVGYEREEGYVASSEFEQNRRATNTVDSDVDRRDAISAESQEFLREAASAGATEVELGRIAAQRAHNDRVRDYGQRMVTDHSSANEDLERVARDVGVQVSSEPNPHHDSMIDRVANEQGESFDREYLNMMVNDHQKVVTKFEEQAQNGPDPEVKAFAQRTLPTLREHLRLARDLADDLDLGDTQARLEDGEGD